MIIEANDDPDDDGSQVDVSLQEGRGQEVLGGEGGPVRPDYNRVFAVGFRPILHAARRIVLRVDVVFDGLGIGMSGVLDWAEAVSEGNGIAHHSVDAIIAGAGNIIRSRDLIATQIDFIGNLVTEMVDAQPFSRFDIDPELSGLKRVA